MSEDKKPFTVSDRRHFTSEGEVRKSDADEPPAASPPAVEGSPAVPAPPEVTAPPSPPPAAHDASAQDAHADDAPDDERPSRFPSDLLGLLISLGAQGSMLLMGGPEGEPPDLESARSLIELLGVLKEKTEGRRTPQEDQLVDGLLYELRMAYVQATKAAGR
jgi:hypothetical protein